jgi:hypothetical protein
MASETRTNPIEYAWDIVRGVVIWSQG